MVKTNYLYLKNSFTMTINEKKQLTNYIKGLVRESIEDRYPKDSNWEKEMSPEEIHKALWDGWDEQDKRRKEAEKQWREAFPEDFNGKKKPKKNGKLIKLTKKNNSNEGLDESIEKLKTYIRGVVKESIAGEMPRHYTDSFGPHADLDDESEEGFYDDEPESTRFYTEDDFLNHGGSPDFIEGDDEDDDDDIAGLNELRKLTESMARNAMIDILSEAKKKKKKRKNKKEKSSSRDKTVMSKLNADGTNAAHYYYKLYGVENGTEAEKAAARSKGYKKAKGKKNDTGVPYKFSSKEKNRLNSLLTDR
jgi:hypothetical protein